MAMSPHIGDREQDKFKELTDGTTAVRVSIQETKDDDGNKQDITAAGEALIQNMKWKEILEDILEELKKMNIQLAYITEQRI